MEGLGYTLYRKCYRMATPAVSSTKRFQNHVLGLARNTQQTSTIQKLLGRGFPNALFKILLNAHFKTFLIFKISKCDWKLQSLQSQTRYLPVQTKTAHFLCPRIQCFQQQYKDRENSEQSRLAPKTRSEQFGLVPKTRSEQSELAPKNKELIVQDCAPVPLSICVSSF